MTWPTYIKASTAWHAAMGAGALAMPGALPWWLGGIAANHLVITGASMTPRSRLLGPNITRLPDGPARDGQVALTFDDGPDPQVTPQVLDLLDGANAGATFFCVGDRIREYPDLAREIVARGHTIQNHTQTHSHRFAFRGSNGFREEIGSAQKTISELTGQTPVLLRAPAGMRNPFLQPVLNELNLSLISWTRRGFDTRERSEEKVLSRLTRNLAGGDILLLHDGNAAITNTGKPIVLTVLPKLLSRLDEHGLRSVSLNEQVMA
jgi:peptidoglycan/xylan/chitin deacetylase (PgdA/CDA1 family)